MIFLLATLALLTVAVLVFVYQPPFGSLPSGARLERIQKSPHYRNGSFQNLSHTPDLTEGVSYYAVLKEFLFSEKPRVKPIDSIPSTKTDLLALQPDENVLVWFGHSSYFMQLDRKKFLVDPVLSGNASPLSFTTKSFKGTDRYTVNDLPEIDYLLISHDHWDHVDYQTLLALKPKIKKIICGLGVGAHFERWGFDANIILEEDWNTTIPLETGFIVHTAPARHFSGRGFSRNKSLWSSYVLETPSTKIYIGGDSGYDTHFAEIGKNYGPFDLVLLENGQYDKSWKYIHMMPEEVLDAAVDLKAKKLFPVHSSKFALGNHSWDDPLIRISKRNEVVKMPLVTPIIGEVVYVKDSTQVFKEWWKGVD